MSEDEHTGASPPDEEAGGDGDGDRPGSEPDADEEAVPPESAEDEAADLRAELEDLRAELADLEGEVGTVETEFEDLEDEIDEFEEGIDDRTVHREEIERDLKRYVRKRVRRGHARDWGPYLVLLYGTAMTLGVFYFFQNSAGYAILAMIIIWLSTLGLFALMLVVGLIFNVLSVPGRARDLLGGLRDRF
jgi:membrane protein